MHPVKKFIKRAGATMLFTGYFPFMPGTIGSFITVLILWFGGDTLRSFFTPENAYDFFLLYLVFLAGAVYLSNDAKEVFGEEDPGKIIIDEMAGQLITFFLVPINIRTLILGFALFRFFDIVKPYPIYKFEELDDGLGIVSDDVAGGIIANVTLFMIISIYHVVRAHIS